nr:MMPL family transporter [Lachnospiraceae bacterium]
MEKICSFIVDKRNLFFLIFIIAIIFSAFSAGWVNVENDIATYLSDETETRKGLNLMEKEFTTYGTASVMVANVSFDQAKEIQKMLEDMEGVFSVKFTTDDDDHIAKHYSNASALFDVTFNYSEDEEECLDALNNMKAQLDGYDYYVSTTLGDQQAEIIAMEMSKIIVIVAIIVVLVLIFTSQTYGEVPVLLLTFVSAAAINMGTNFLFGTISFVSNSVTVVLQLALSIDYAIIFCNRFKEERKEYSVRDAAIVSLGKAIPEITSSSLTTISGLLALTFMQFGIGRDMGVVLIKAIIISLLAVFLLMPGLLVIFSGIMEKTKHKNFVPDIPFVGKFAYATRKIIPPVFLVLVCIAAYLANNCPYVYGYSTLTTPILNENQIAANMIRDNFEENNFVALCVPGADYEAEKKLISQLNGRDEVDEIVSLSSQEAMGGYVLTDALTPRQLSEVLDMDVDLCELLYSAYAADKEEYGRIVGGISRYRIPLIDTIMYAYDKTMEGYVNLDPEVMDTLTDIYKQIENARKQLQGENYDRMLVYLNLPQESEETFAFLDEMHTICEDYYGEKPVYVVGESTSQYDLQKSFARDNVVVSVLSILFVLAILLFTFQSAGMPLLLILVIQGAIFINFSFPTVLQKNLFFM